MAESVGPNSLPQPELDRDWAVRCGVHCPICGAVIPDRCAYRVGGKGSSMTMSHTARYDLAAALGLVVPIPPSPGRGVAVRDIQTIPSGLWTRIAGHEAEVFQMTGKPQNLAIVETRLRWLNGSAYPELALVRLRPPGGVYPHGWVPCIAGSWWVAEVPTNH